jgi:phage shock protein PspC (stress-responsive transcriptional regulator)
MERRLYRSRTEKIIAGVCGGLAEYFNTDPTIVRLIWVLVTLLGGAGILAYIILWILMPLQSPPPPAQ